MNASVEERIGRFFPSIVRPSGLDFQRTATVTSTTVPVNAALSLNPRYATYYRHLSLEGHGIPLWLPEPNENHHINYRRRGAAIGDVVMYTSNGGLHFLFNICLDAHDPINGNDVPEGFSPFIPALRPSDTYRSQDYGEDSYLASKSITKKRERHGPAGLWFQSSASEGAILTMPEGAYSEDLVLVRGFKRYLAENLDSWYQYVNEVREWGVEQGELHLVTGVHKAKAWGIATFSNERTTAMDLHMIFRSNDDDDTSTGDLYSWEYEGIVDSTRAGPTRRQRRIIFEGLPEAEREPFENQCLFVRTWNAAIQKPEAIKDRESDAIVVPASEANKTIHPTDMETSGSAELNHSASRGGFNEAHNISAPDQLGALDGLSIARNEFLLRDHPSKAINEFLLKEKPNGRIAITHDQDWISLLTEDDVALPSGDELVARLKRSCKIIVDEGIISLEHQDSQLNIIARIPEQLDSEDQSVPDTFSSQAIEILPVHLVDSLRISATSQGNEAFSDSGDSILPSYSRQKSDPRFPLPTLFNTTSNDGPVQSGPEDGNYMLYPDTFKIDAETNDRSMSANNLANAILPRFELHADVRHLDKAILLYREALLQPKPHPDRSTKLSNLAGAVFTRFEQQGDKNDLDEAISLYREALILRPEHHPNRSTGLSNLAGAVFTRFEQQGDKNDLNEAISLYQEALIHRPSPDPNRSISLSNLAGAVFTRFEQQGDKNDLDNVISWYREALVLQPSPHPNRSIALSNLADAVLTRFKQQEDVSHLDEAISLYREALLHPSPHPNRSIALSNLGGAVLTRYKQQGAKNDLDEAISLYREAFDLQPVSHPERSNLLRALAIALQSRFEKSHLLQDIDDVISLHRQLLHDCAIHDHNRDWALKELSTALRERSALTSIRSNVTKVVLPQNRNLMGTEESSIGSRGREQ